MWQRYIAFGDSVTAGVGDPVDGVEMKSWSDWVAASLVVINPGLSYTNLGQGGSTTAHVLSHQLPEVLSAKPDLVSLTIGANDARFPKWRPESFARDLEKILEPIAAQGADILTMAYPDLRSAIVLGENEIPPTWRLYFRRMKAANQVIREVSAQVNAILLDYESFAPAQDPAHISSDLVHPNALGHKRAGENALEILADRFGLVLPAPSP